VCVGVCVCVVYGPTKHYIYMVLYNTYAPCQERTLSIDNAIQI